jgi:plasmid stabilization system protein ParE
MRVRILRPALDDLAAGREFYDRQHAGVGDRFFASLFTEVDSLVAHAGIHRTHFGYHRLLAKHFPYAIYYRVIQNEAVVYRVLDCRRDPMWIRRALQKAT